MAAARKKKPTKRATKGNRHAQDEAKEDGSTQVALYVGALVIALLGVTISFGVKTSSVSEIHSFDVLANMTLTIHRNGETEPCGSSVSGVVELNTAFRQAIHTLTSAPRSFSKYHVDYIITSALAKSILPADKCTPDPSDENEKQHIKDDSYQFLRYCDWGEDKTPILPDHAKHILVPSTLSTEGTLPCHFHTREGVRITSMNQFTDLARNIKASSSQRELHLYAVSAGHHFMFAPSYVGEVFDLPHVSLPSGLPLSLEVLSTSPRVFEIRNFFNKQEADKIVSETLADPQGMERSTTAKGEIVPKRTSENGWNLWGKTAMTVKRRCFNVLGFDRYEERFADGLQVLRYNESTAYHPHWDFSPTNRKGHNYDSSGVGTNRFATILLYMSDLPKGGGGETIFVNAWPPREPTEKRVQIEEALNMVRTSRDAKITFEEGSWEEKMLAECRTRLAIEPKAAKAVLFYSQLPDGKKDVASKHGGCPVLDGEKWAANLWVWNGPRIGYDDAPK